MSGHYYEFRMVDKESLVEVTRKVPGDLTASDLREEFKLFLLSVGYHPDTVKELFEEN